MLLVCSKQTLWRTFYFEERVDVLKRTLYQASVSNVVSNPNVGRPGYFFCFVGRFQPSIVVWRARAMVSLPAGT